MKNQEVGKVKLDKEQGMKYNDGDLQVQVTMHSVSQVVSQLTTLTKDFDKIKPSSSDPNQLTNSVSKKISLVLVVVPIQVIGRKYSSRTPKGKKMKNFAHMIANPI